MLTAIQQWVNTDCEPNDRKNQTKKLERIKHNKNSIIKCLILTSKRRRCCRQCQQLQQTQSMGLVPWSTHPTSCPGTAVGVLLQWAQPANTWFHVNNCHNYTSIGQTSELVLYNNSMKDKKEKEKRKKYMYLLNANKIFRRIKQPSVLKSQVMCQPELA